MLIFIKGRMEITGNQEEMGTDGWTAQRQEKQLFPTRAFQKQALLMISSIQKGKKKWHQRKGRWKTKAERFPRVITLRPLSNPCHFPATPLKGKIHLEQWLQAFNKEGRQHRQSPALSRPRYEPCWLPWVNKIRETLQPHRIQMPSTAEVTATGGRRGKRMPAPFTNPTSMLVPKHCSWWWRRWEGVALLCFFFHPEQTKNPSHFLFSSNQKTYEAKIVMRKEKKTPHSKLSA